MRSMADADQSAAADAGRTRRPRGAEALRHAHGHPHVQGPGRTPRRLPTGLAFPGAGVFFWWQAGVLVGLRDAGLDPGTNSLHVAGASAGSLAAAFAVCGVDMHRESLADERRRPTNCSRRTARRP